jgi:hypothetical protein
MRLVVLESPFAGNTELNIKYAKACLRDCLERGEAPIASHLLFTQPGILNDQDPEERKLGIEAGHAWIKMAEASVVYGDRGMSKGMLQGVGVAQMNQVTVELRFLGEDVLKELDLIPGSVYDQEAVAAAEKNRTTKQSHVCDDPDCVGFKEPE